MILASAGNVVVWIVWVVAAFACLGSAVAVVSFSNPFYSALALIGNLGSLAVMYLLLSAEFVAAAQVLVYAGAVVVMFLFVIAYVGPRQETPWAGGPSWQTLGAVLAGASIFVEIIVVLGLKQYHINQPHRDVQARMKRRARKHFRRKSVKTLNHFRPSIAKCAQD